MFSPNYFILRKSKNNNTIGIHLDKPNCDEDGIFSNYPQMCRNGDTTLRNLAFIKINVFTKLQGFIKSFCHWREIQFIPQILSFFLRRQKILNIQ